MNETSPRHDWTREEIAALYQQPLDALFASALTIKRANWPDGQVQASQLLSIKTGGCAEDCGYCAQSAHFDTGVGAEKLMPLEEVVAAARRAREGGADRFCMGAGWRNLKDRDVPRIQAMIEGVKAEGLETCVTLGMLAPGQAEALRSAGLDYYNHNLDTSPEYYGKVVTTRTYADRLETLAMAREAGLKLCCGGILGMGETEEDRIGLIHELAKLDPHPESVPINRLVPIPGTPLGGSEPIPVVAFARVIAVCRIVFPQSWVRLAAGRDDMSQEAQTLCLLAGANSIFVGDRLLTTDNPGEDADGAMLSQAGFAPAGRATMQAGRETLPAGAPRTTLIDARN